MFPGGYVNNACSCLLVCVLLYGIGLRTGTFPSLGNLLEMPVLQKLWGWCQVICVLLSLSGDSWECYSLDSIALG